MSLTLQVSTFSRFLLSQASRSQLSIISRIDQVCPINQGQGEQPESRVKRYLLFPGLSTLLYGEFTHHSPIQLLNGANNARSDDISRMKSAVADFLNQRLNGPPDPPLHLDVRDNRGLQNDFTGRLLCPITYDWEDPV